MLSLLRFLLWAGAKLLISLRYRVFVHGLEKLGPNPQRTLILPNHPGYMDPPLVFSSLWPVLKPRPLLFEGNFQNPVLSPLMSLMQAIPLPDMERPSAKARARTARAINEVIEGLRKGENHMLWPSGTLWRDGLEHLGGAQATGEIIRAVPDIRILLVRTRGLWGSRSTFAYAGKKPKFPRFLRKGAALLAANLLMLAPRRRIDITVDVLRPDQLPDLDRNTLNPFLEKWYNAPGREEPTFVPYHFFFGRRSHEFPKGAAADPQLAQVTPQTRAEVLQIVERKLKRRLTDAEKQPETVIAQLGMDSLDRMDITLEVEQRFGFSSDQSPSTLGDLWLLAQGLAVKAKSQPVPRAWSREPSSKEPPAIQGETIAEAFVHRALASRADVAAADDQAGVLTYGRMLAGSLTLARRFANLPGTNVGLLLPASVGCDIALLGLSLAGKVPVVLNWTTGPANLEHAVRLLDLHHVVTSNLFIDRLEEKIVEAIKHAGAKYLCLEDLRATIGRMELVRTLLAVRFAPGRIRRQIVKVSADQPAVVLFTSGSERAPKAVPLTHNNLLSNERASLETLALTRQDAVLGFLPSFHSFGLSVTGLMPLLSGLRVVHHPDPTAATTLARKAAIYQTTLMAGTPTFVRAILDRGRPEQLQALRLIFVGAEKSPEDLYERCRQQAPSAKLLEGYGITECSPVIAVNPPAAPRPGTVGKPLPGFQVRIVEIKEPDPLVLGDEVPPGTMGMLLVSGPSVFPGYLGEEESPFVEQAGQRWYVSGDLAERDAEGYIRLAGRLKRFLKAGGEMISLPALEAPLTARYPTTEEGPRVAVEGTETPRRIVLFTTLSISRDEANEVLHEAGLRGIMRLDDVRQLDKIPVLGSGKVDHKALRAMVK
jgi:long-chain-fatty-acid--[acyl-carrier-protein] ligase